MANKQHQLALTLKWAEELRKILSLQVSVMCMDKRSIRRFLGFTMLLSGWFLMALVALNVLSHNFGFIALGIMFVGAANLNFISWFLNPLVRRLGNSKQSEQALRQLLSIDKEKAVPILMDAFHSPPSVEHYLFVSWDGFLARTQAAKGLGMLREKEAVKLLLSTLSPSPFSRLWLQSFDPTMKSRINKSRINKMRKQVIWALGEIGDETAVPHIIPLLGDFSFAGENETISQVAAEALQKLGEENLVKAFLTIVNAPEDVSQDEFSESVRILRTTQYRREVAQAFMKLLDLTDKQKVKRAAWALAKIHAIEALPKLRRKVRSLFTPSTVRTVCLSAIKELEQFATLLSPAIPTTIDTNTLPRPANLTEIDTSTLPRPADPASD